MKKNKNKELYNTEFLRIYPYNENDGSTSYRICYWIKRDKVNKNLYVTTLNAISSNEMLKKISNTSDGITKYIHDPNSKFYLEGTKNLNEMLFFLDLPYKSSYTYKELINLEIQINELCKKNICSLKKVLKK